jgi:MoxR-like ATPase
VNQLVRLTRPQMSSVSFVKEYVEWGAGTRAGQALILTAKARAFLQERYAVTPDDLRATAYPALRHRLVLNFKAQAEKISVDDVVTQLLTFLGKTPTGL